MSYFTRATQPPDVVSDDQSQLSAQSQQLSIKISKSVKVIFTPAGSPGLMVAGGGCSVYQIGM